MPELFASFAGRLTRSYVLQAVAMIVLLVATTSLLAFLLYAGSLNESIASAAQRATQRAATYERVHEALPLYAPAIAGEIGGSRVRVLVYDTNHHLLAQGGGRASEPGRLSRAAAAVLGLHASSVDVAGGRIVIAPDLGGFARLLGRYLAFVVPVGALAVLATWLMGRAIARRAIAPLEDVALALRRIAGGDFTPEPLRLQDSDLRALTTAYNDVAHRLTTATAQRDRNETQMRQFVADAGHELRTPLTIIMGYLEVLEQGVVTDRQSVARIQETMLAESRRMRVAIDKLILLARLERPATPRSECVDLGELAQRVAAELAPLAGPERITVSAPAKATAVAADATEIYEAIKNVIENAVRYAPGSPIAVDVSSNGGRAVLAVTDRGPGMNEQDAEHAFDRFYRGEARANREGSGLGLAIAKRAVERVGGSIEISSSLGAGTRVIMSFPQNQQTGHVVSFE